MELNYRHITVKDDPNPNFRVEYDQLFCAFYNFKMALIVVSTSESIAKIIFCLVKA